MCRIREFFLYSDSNSFDVGANYFHVNASTPLSFVYQGREMDINLLAMIYTDSFKMVIVSLPKGAQNVDFEQLEL